MKYDLIVVGGGVLGTFHALAALKKGLRVLVLEKDQKPSSASVRNFGQVVPSGMNTKWQNYGRQSLAIYNDIQSQLDISVRNNGSVYLASNEEELTLLEELHQINKSNDYTSTLLTKSQCLARYDGVKESYVKGGLFFEQELTVEPRVMVSRVQSYMTSQYQVEFLFGHNVIGCQEVGHQVEVTLANQQKKYAQKVIICCGSEFKTLFPDVFLQSDLELTKLQMMQSIVQPNNYTLKGSILTGLSIRRYEAFSECPSYAQIKAQEPLDSLDKKWGVHILFKQASDGSIIIGDSHQYADVSHSEDLGFAIRQDINDYMIQQAKEIFNLPSFTIQQSWFGIYSQCKNADIFNHTIGERIHIITGIGGKGMTGSAGFAQHSINTIFN